MKKLTIELFLPAYNEGKIIINSIDELLTTLASLQAAKFQLYLVNDGSTDNTNAYSIELNEKKVKMITFKNGPSRRENLAKAMSKSKADYVMFMDVDLSTNLKHMPEMLQYMTEGYDVITGSRNLVGANVKRDVKRRMISNIYNTAVRIYFGSKIRDHQCGFKAIKTEQFRKLYREAGYDSQFKRGWFWDAEMLIRAQKMNLRIKEFPVKWTARDSNRFSIKRELKMLPYAALLRFRI